MAIETINPFTNKSEKVFQELSDQELESKIATAHKRFESWKDTKIEKRAELLHKVAAIMRKRKEELAGIITLEMGKLIAQSESEIEICASVYEYYATNGAEFMKDKELKVNSGRAIMKHSPIGIILGVEPWNYPFNQVGRLAAPNIMLGNVVMIKHASNVPQCAQMIEDIFKEAGAEEGIYTNLFLNNKRIAKIAEDPRIVGMSLTGSEKAGSSLAEAAGKNLKKSVLELGGSDAFIVLDDADMDKAIESAMKGRFGNMGQACTSAKRMIVLDSVADEFTSRLVKNLKDLKVGNPADASTQVGPLSSEEAAEKIQKQVDETVKAGAKVIIGGKRIDREGAFYEPTILTDIKKGMPAYSEEIFGPVAMIYKVKDENEAIKLANDSNFGLGGSVYSKNIERAIKVASQIETGMIFINEPTASRADLPFGGTKRSGYGRELAAYGMNEFVNKKLIYVGE